jgi:hypothetical protein
MQNDPFALDEYEQSIEDSIETFMPIDAEIRAKIDAAIEGYAARKRREGMASQQMPPTSTISTTSANESAPMIWHERGRREVQTVV